MKNLLSILLVLLFTNLISQTEQVSKSQFTYSLTIQDVNTKYEAKELMEPLILEFGSYPTFNDSTSVFIFESNNDLTKNKVFIMLSKYDYTLGVFNKSSRLIIIDKEKLK